MLSVRKENKDSSSESHSIPFIYLYKHIVQRQNFITFSFLTSSSSYPGKDAALLTSVGQSPQLSQAIKKQIILSRS